MKKKLLFWIVQLTWGLLMNLLGLVIFIALVISGHKPKRFHQMLYFELGKGWGGFNAGFVSVVCKPASETTLLHEHGHFIQNWFFGPLEVFITLASATRYWYRVIISKYFKEKFKTMPGYYVVWFEKQANYFGQKYLKEEE